MRPLALKSQVAIWAPGCPNAAIALSPRRAD
jgi:hypothetical protein